MESSMRSNSVPRKKTASKNRVSSGLSDLETEVIALFIQFFRALGAPKSTAEIYGLLFLSAEPLSMDELIGRLNLSKGAGSQGLRFLRNLGAVKVVYVPGNRRDHYEAETELRALVGGFLKEKLIPHFESGSARLARIEGLAARTPAASREHASARIQKLRSWESSGRQLLPLIGKILNPP
jgi:DNA-binding transcriptional regulator GbsR (MarR family)